MPALKKGAAKPFTKVIITKGYGFNTPQDGSVCKIKVISDKMNIMTDLNESNEKEIIVGDVDEPIDRIIEDCVRMMKEEEECVLSFEHPCLSPDHVIDSDAGVEPKVTSPGDTLESLSTGDKTATEVNAEDKTETEVNAEDKTETEVNAEDKTEPEVNAEDKTETEVNAVDKTETDANSDDKIKADVNAEAKTEVNSEDRKEPNGKLDSVAGDSKTTEDNQNVVKVTESYDELLPLESESSKEDSDSKGRALSNRVEVQLQLISYTREPEIWEMSVTEKWRRATYHKRRGLELYSRGAYQYAFRRFGLTLKYVISLEHDIPSGQEEGMDIKGLKLSCYLNVAACQMRHYNYESVVVNSSKALAMQPNNAKALYRRGAAYVQLQEYEKAKVDLMKAQQLEPKNQAVAKQLQLLKSQMQKLNDYYATAMKKLFT